MSDPRVTPATDRVALAGSGIARPATTEGRKMRVAAPLAELCRDPAGRRDRQLRMGADVIAIDARDGWRFVQAEADGYCGWIDAALLTDDRAPVTHRIGAPASHIYPGPDLKLRERAALSLGARLSVTATEGRFGQIGPGQWVPLQHLTHSPAPDAADVAQSLIGTPYLWGGNSRAGIDCSGLVQTALHAAGIACPGDADLQYAAFPPAEGETRRGDLLFWKGHVAMALDAQTMIHATAFTMSVITEDIAPAKARIEAAGDGAFIGIRRPPPVALAFP